MSRSYRRPYCAVTGLRSASHDKLVARRCFRRMQNYVLQNYALHGDPDWQEFVIPVRFEASFNDTYSWGRDGRQSLQPEPTFAHAFGWALCRAKYHPGTDEEILAEALKDFERDKKWYAKLKRK